MKKAIIISGLFLLAGGSKLIAQPGMLDPGFGNAGIVITNTADFNEAYAVAMQPDGKIVAGGYSGNYGYEDFALVRYNTNGSLDNLFGTGGKVVTQISPTVDRGQAVLIQPDGKIVLIGYAESGSVTKIAVARYLTNGTLDNTFGTGGITTNLIGNGLDYGYAGVLQPDGKIIVAGYSANGMNGDVALVRYNTNGTLDMSFGTGGFVMGDIGGDFDLAFAVLLQPDGKIITAGYSKDTVNLKYNFGVIRFNSNGSYDNSFGTGGKVITAVGSTEDCGTSAVLQPDGKIVVAGYTWMPNHTRTKLAVVRYDSNGSLDAGFGTGGKVIDTISVMADALAAVALQADGKIVAAGSTNGAPNIDFSLIRLDTNGNFDTSFNSTGKVVTNTGTGVDYASAMTLQADGKIVVAGTTVINSAQDVDFTVLRYLSGTDVGVIDFSAENNAVFVYPNPVAENTELEYTLTQKERISIYITDMQGRIISQVLSGEMQDAGKHRQVFDMPETAASGTYLLVLTTDEGKVSVKIEK